TPNGPAYVHRDFQETALTKTGEFNGDVRTLGFKFSPFVEKPEQEQPEAHPRLFVPPSGTGTTAMAEKSAAPKDSPKPSFPTPAVAATTPSIQFDGLSIASGLGNGYPPDTNGDVGPTYYIQTVNTGIGIYNKSNGTAAATMSFNTFFAGHFGGNLCETQNFGD